MQSNTEYKGSSDTTTESKIPKSENDDGKHVAYHSKRNFGRIINGIAFILCFLGFTFQQAEFFKHFKTYPTVISIESAKPGNFVVPAITFCNTHPLQRSKYCSIFPIDCIPPKNVSYFCKRKPHLCEGNTTNYVYPNPGKEFMLFGVQDIPKLGQDSSDFFMKKDEDVQTVFFEDTKGLFRQCFTMNGHFDGKQEAKIRIFDPPARGSRSTLVSSFNLNVNMDEKFDLTSSSESGVLVSIHSPYEITNPYFKGTLMRPRHEYKIHIKLEEETLLKYPYKTDCMDYGDLWKNNNSSGPLSQQICQQRCQEIFSLSCFKCIQNLAVYTNLSGACDVSVKSTASDCENDQTINLQLQECNKNCKTECKKLKYEFTSEERLLAPTIKVTSRNILAHLPSFLGRRLKYFGNMNFLPIPIFSIEEKGYTVINPDFGYLIQLEIFVDDPEILVLTHQPLYKFVELFSYIGGFLGWWLGISIWAFVGYIGSFISTVTSFFRKPSPIRLQNRKSEEVRKDIHQESVMSHHTVIEMPETTTKESSEKYF